MSFLRNCVRNTCKKWSRDEFCLTILHSHGDHPNVEKICSENLGLKVWLPNDSGSRSESCSEKWSFSHGLGREGSSERCSRIHRNSEGCSENGLSTPRALFLLSFFCFIIGVVPRLLNVAYSLNHRQGSKSMFSHLRWVVALEIC